MDNPFTDMTAHCDMCERPATTWPTGLVNVTREYGVFGGDFTVCPDCVITATFGPDALTGQLANGIHFTRIDWYWFTQTPPQSVCRRCRTIRPTAQMTFLDAADANPICPECLHIIRHVLDDQPRDNRSSTTTPWAE